MAYCTVADVKARLRDPLASSTTARDRDGNAVAGRFSDTVIEETIDEIAAEIDALAAGYTTIPAASPFARRMNAVGAAAELLAYFEDDAAAEGQPSRYSKLNKRYQKMVTMVKENANVFGGTISGPIYAAGPEDE
jgi:phage gp36-like protein